MTENHLRLSENDKHIIQKARLISLSPVYSPIQSYIRRYTCTHSYRKIRHESPRCACHYYLYVRISSVCEIFVTIFIKAPHISENMTIWPHDSTKYNGWGQIDLPGTAPRELF